MKQEKEFVIGAARVSVTPESETPSENTGATVVEEKSEGIDYDRYRRPVTQEDLDNCKETHKVLSRYFEITHHDVMVNTLQDSLSYHLRHPDIQGMEMSHSLVDVVDHIQDTILLIIQLHKVYEKYSKMNKANDYRGIV